MHRWASIPDENVSNTPVWKNIINSKYFRVSFPSPSELWTPVSHHRSQLFSLVKEVRCQFKCLQSSNAEVCVSGCWYQGNCHQVHLCHDCPAWNKSGSGKHVTSVNSFLWTEYCTSPVGTKDRAFIDRYIQLLLQKRLEKSNRSYKRVEWTPLSKKNKTNRGIRTVRKVKQSLRERARMFSAWHVTPKQADSASLARHRKRTSMRRWLRRA